MLPGSEMESRTRAWSFVAEPGGPEVREENGRPEHCGQEWQHTHEKTWCIVKLYYQDKVLNANAWKRSPADLREARKQIALY